MATHFKKILDISIVGLLVSLLIVPSARSVTLTGGRLVEDFSTDTYADYAASTGLWDTVNNRARAAAVANGTTARPISFGDGSDGAANSANGYTFNTDTRPSGFNFSFVNITGGTITVTGSNPLIIKSLTTVNIGAAVTFSVDGGNGTNGTSGVAGSANGGSGGTAVTCSAHGGSGGAATTTLPSDGADGSLSNGTLDLLTGGLAHDDNGVAGSGDDGTPTLTAALNINNFETTDFVCRPGGGGGGADANTLGGSFATGGGGGAGGGRVRIAAIGNITVATTITARGGTPGQGGNDGIDKCAGNGAGGNGGAVWVQTLGEMDVLTSDVSGGLGVINACHPFSVDGNNGNSRGDCNTVAPGIGRLAQTFATTNAAPNESYIVQSKAYDLNTLNAVFRSASVSSSTPGGGSVATTYAASVDGSSFSEFTNDIASLSNKNYRFLKFKVTITTAGIAAASPQVSQVAVDFSDAGLEKLQLKLSPGCGTIQNTGGAMDTGPTDIMRATLAWSLFWFMSYLVLRRRSHRST